ncbi:hypothetical protein [Burkholderia lata]|uniref:hypothetical protein n=1 Tax=Burkholderia lata (strain ATCC 17760 / DSM 23089 / LMG 22485 / NCIMB 9086 / R18194 / 383) TaxID=482957 RepID=UPI00399C453B
MTQLTDGKALEAMCAFDLVSRCLIGAGVGQSSTVQIPDPARLILDDPNRSLRLVHTHPDPDMNVSLSEPDVAFLWSSPAISEVEAVLLDGSYFRAHRPPDVDWSRQKQFAENDLLNMVIAAQTVEMCEGLSDNYFYNQVRTHVVLQALHEFVLSEENRSHLSIFRARREYGFRYEAVLTANRAKYWQEPANGERLQDWVRLTLDEFRRIT